MNLIHIGKSIRPLVCSAEHSHLCWELVYNIEGRGTVFVENKVYSFSPGSIILYPPGAVHKKLSNSTFVDYYLRISSCDLIPDVYCMEDDCEQTILQLIKVVHTCFHNSATLPICQSLLESIMMLVKSHLTEDFVANKYVMQMRNAMISHFSDSQFSVRDVMSDIPLSADHARRLFKEAFGTTPQEFLMYLRIDNAKHLLSQTYTDQISISEVAYLSGFYDPLYFSRAFKKRTGQSPKEFLKTQAVG